MRFFSSTILATAMFCGVPAAAYVSDGPKIIEIDEAGRIRTSNGTGDERNAAEGTKDRPNSALMPSEIHASMSICDPRYRWEPRGLSSATVSRVRSFYRDVTRLYEMAQVNAKKQGAPLSHDRENRYWNAHKKMLDSVAPKERAIADRGISPRLSWWCNAPPLIQKSPPPPPVPR